MCVYQFVMVSVDASAWRRRWRAIGLAADRLLPTDYAVPAPSFQQLHVKIATSLIVPGNGRWKFSDEDKALILDGSVFHFAKQHNESPLQTMARP